MISKCLKAVPQRNPALVDRKEHYEMTSIRSRVRNLAAAMAAATMSTLVSLPAMAQYGQWGYGHQGWGHGGWAMMLGGVLMLGIVVLVILAIVALARGLLGGHRHGRGPRDASERRAIDVLDERYARGEIDHDEYEERRRRLSAS